MLGRKLNPGATILVDRKEELTGEEGESLVDIKIIEGEPQAKVTVPPDEPAEPEEAPVARNSLPRGRREAASLVQKESPRATRSSPQLSTNEIRRE